MTTSSQIVVYILILVANLLWTLIVWIAVADKCTGTGMGSNSILLLCQDYADFAPALVFAINLLVFARALRVIRTVGLGGLPQAVVILVVTVAVFALSTLIPLFLFMIPVQ